VSFKLAGSSRAAGSCGEMVQGSRNGTPFLVTCPVNIWTEVTVRISLSGEGKDATYFPKIRRAVKEVLKIKRSSASLSFYRKSAIPPGKGMSSSTADIAAAALATSRLLGGALSPEKIAELALSIEPSDGIMFPGIHLLDHRRGSWSESLGPPPAMEVVIIDPGGCVDTVAFNRRNDLVYLNRQKEKKAEEALLLVREGVRQGDPEKIGRGATISARANQRILPKKELGEVIRLSREIKAVGVNVAHSGTVLGILLPPGAGRAEEAAAWLAHKYPYCTVQAASLISQGLN